MRRLVYVLIVVLIVGSGYGWYRYKQATAFMIALTPDAIDAMQAETATQDESVFAQPAPLEAVRQAASKDKNLYFGDLHVHTSLSFDSYLFGNRNTLDNAYDFARGKPLTTMAGERMQLSRPLDFVAITDHAETFGLMDICLNQTDIAGEMKAFCSGFDNPSLGFFMKLRTMGAQRPPTVPDFICEMTDGDCQAFARDLGRPMWELIKRKADENNNPGVFTAFAAYEYSPTLPEGGKHHRNVFFRNSNTSRYAYSAYDARTAPELWQMLESDCVGDCEFLTIPHNMNKTWGLAYALHTIDGDPYTDADWARRARYEPLAEIYQIKGASECATGQSTVDEECSYEQFFPLCEDGETLGCISPTSMVRDGLKQGLVMAAQQGINPFKVGFVGATDTHNANPGDAEEYDYRGAAGVFSSPASRRLDADDPKRTWLERNPGGLAAVWARENTRDALFDSLKRREAYATSGTRIQLRFFAGKGFDDAMLNSSDVIAQAYAAGVPMGGDLQLAPDTAPTFLAIAQMDTLSVPLDRVQVIKGWLVEGRPQESVTDVACSDGRRPDVQGRCPDLAAPVEPGSCTPSKGKGAPQLAAVWSDPHYNPAEDAFYYLRVLEIPTCRWSTYDALRLGQSPPDNVPTTQRERAWSSPIWTRPIQQ